MLKKDEIEHIKMYKLSDFIRLLKLSYSYIWLYNYITIYLYDYIINSRIQMKNNPQVNTLSNADKKTKAAMIAKALIKALSDDMYPI